MSETSGSSASAKATADSAAVSRVLFVTGKLAEPALRRILAETNLPFAADLAVMRITVAALMEGIVQPRGRTVAVLSGGNIEWGGLAPLIADA